MKGTLSSLVAALALVVVAGGCGGGESSSTLSKAEYETTVAAAGKNLASQFEGISKQANALSSGPLGDTSQLFEDLGVVVSHGETELRAFADQLATLSAPNEARAANAALASAFGLLADDFGSLGAALEDGSINDITQLSARLQAIGSSKAGTEIQSAIRQLEDAGFNFDAGG